MKIAATFDAHRRKIRLARDKFFSSVSFLFPNLFFKFDKLNNHKESSKPTIISVIIVSRICSKAHLTNLRREISPY